MFATAGPVPSGGKEWSLEFKWDFCAWFALLVGGLGWPTFRKISRSYASCASWSGWPAGRVLGVV
jgi:hypothetical protein